MATYTFYPDAGNPGSTSADGNPEYRAAATFATAHDAATATHIDFNGTGVLYHYNTLTGGLYYLARVLAYFDTSSIVDSETVSTATLSLMPSAINSTADDTTITGMSATSGTNSYSTADYNNFDSTKFATDVNWTTYTLNVYKDFAFNASGVAAISKTGVTQIGIRAKTDYDNTTTSSDKSLGFYSADTAGTTSDPKLVVVTSSSATYLPQLMTLNVG